jgi:Uncharacterised protein family (UPF0014)
MRRAVTAILGRAGTLRSISGYSAQASHDKAGDEHAAGKQQPGHHSRIEPVFGLRVHGGLLVAAIRMMVQLALVGLVLTVLFSVVSALWLVPIQPRLADRCGTDSSQTLRWSKADSNCRSLSHPSCNFAETRAR